MKQPETIEMWEAGFPKKMAIFLIVFELCLGAAAMLFLLKFGGI